MNSWLQHCKWNELWLPGRLSHKWLLLICLSWRPIPRLYVSAIKSHLDHPRWKTKNRWRSVDAHFEDGAGSVFHSLLPIKDANALIMCIHYHVAFLLPDFQDQKSLTLSWCLFWRWGRERVAFCVAYRECQHIDYVYSLPSRVFITRHMGPKIVDAPLTLIFKMGQGACFLLFCLQRTPILWLCVFTTRSRFYYPTYRTKNRWRSVDAHFQDGARSVLRSFFPIRDAKTSIVYIHYQNAFLLPDLQHQKSLTLCWCSFCHGHIHNISWFHLAENIINNVLTPFLSSSCTISFITTLFFNNTYK